MKWGKRDDGWSDDTTCSGIEQWFYARLRAYFSGVGDREAGLSIRVPPDDLSCLLEWFCEQKYVYLAWVPSEVYREGKKNDNGVWQIA